MEGKQMTISAKQLKSDLKVLLAAIQSVPSGLRYTEIVHLYNGCFRLTGNDYTVYLDAPLNVVAAVSLVQLNDVAKNIPPTEQVSFEVADGKLIIKTTHSTLSIPLAEEAARDLLVCPEPTVTLELPATELAQGVLNGATSLADYGGGFNILEQYAIEQDRFGIDIASTDGSTLSRYRIPSESQDRKHFVLPGHELLGAVKHLGKVDGVARLTSDTKVTRLQYGRLDLAVTAYKTPFPRFNQLIPDHKPAPITIELTTKALKSAIAAIKPAVSPRTRCIHLLISDVLTLAVHDGDNFTARAIVQGSRVDGPMITLGMNYQYLLDAVLAAGDKATLHVTGDESPMMVTNGQQLKIVMPIRTEVTRRQHNQSAA